jgi:hypothetical protein
MAGTITHNLRQASSATIARHEIAWVSDASGNASGDLTHRVAGTVLRVVHKPDTGGTKPSDNYDVTLSDEAGVDLFAGQGANVDADAPIDLVPGVPFTDGTTTSVAPIVLNDTLTLSVTNAGNAKGGTIYLYTR